MSFSQSDAVEMRTPSYKCQPTSRTGVVCPGQILRKTSSRIFCRQEPLAVANIGTTHQHELFFFPKTNLENVDISCEHHFDAVRPGLQPQAWKRSCRSSEALIRVSRSYPERARTCWRKPILPSGENFGGYVIFSEPAVSKLNVEVAPPSSEE